MKPRITFSLKPDGTLELSVNEAGRDLLVQELKHLSASSDHFHFGPNQQDEMQVRSQRYGPEDRVIEYGKVLFRPDAWDRQYFPHVLDER